MTLFWITASAAVLLALGFALLPLIAGGDSASRQARRKLRALDELEDQLDPEDYRQRRQALAARVADSAGNESTPWAVWFALLVAIPAATVLMYRVVGSPEGIEDGQTQAEMIRAGLITVARQLERNPDDMESWIVLGGAYKDLQEYSSAEHAFRRALYLDEGNPFIKVELAETLLFASGSRQLPESSRELLARAVELDPENQKGLWLLGIGAFQQGDHGQAIAYWERLMDILPEGSVRQSVGEQLARARMAGGIDPFTDLNADGPFVDVVVELAEALAGQAPLETTVYVIVRAAGGPSAPLAVERLNVADLPTAVRFSDGHAMIEGMGISSAEAIEVTARVSFSGSAQPEPGDLEGHAGPIPLTELDRVRVVIDRRLD